MIRIGLLLAFAYFATVACIYLTAASEIEGAKLYGSVCLSVRDEAASGPNEVPFSPEVEPGPGKSIITHAGANAPCVLLVVAFNQDDRRLAYRWHPQFAELSAERTEVTLPEKSHKWNWETKSKPFEIYVLFLSPSSPLANEIKSLVTAMQSPNEEESLIKLQTNKLYELVSGEAAQDADLSKHQPTAKVTEIGGVLRGPTVFLWTKFAVKVNFDDRNSGLLVFQSGA